MLRTGYYVGLIIPRHTGGYCVGLIIPAILAGTVSSAQHLGAAPTRRRVRERRGAMQRPLTGVRVLDLSQFLAGPTAACFWVIWGLKC